MAEINEEGIIVSDNTIYVPQTWIDEVDECTPLSAERLNHMELGIANCAERWNSLSQNRVRVAFYTSAEIFQANTNKVVASPEQLRKDLGLSLDAKGTFIPVCESGDLAAYSGGFMARASLADGATIRVPFSQAVRYMLWVVFIPD